MQAVEDSSTTSHVVPKPRIKYADFARSRSGPTVGALINRYLTEIEPIKHFGQTHRYALEMLAREPIGKSRPRDRRPSPEEFERLHSYFLVQDQDPRSEIKMATMMDFAVWSCRRISEICRIRWDDVNHEDRTYLIRDMKDPRHKVGNHFEAPALGKAWDIIIAQPKVDERIFPWCAKSAGARYTIAKNRHGIENLRFHDLRREGICRLFEAGYGPQEVAAVSGHKNWAILARVYANSFKAKDLHKGPAALRAAAANQPIALAA